MEQVPSWEANSFSASQEVPRILWNNMKVQYCIHTCPQINGLYHFKYNRTFHIK